MCLTARSLTLAKSLLAGRKVIRSAASGPDATQSIRMRHWRRQVEALEDRIRTVEDNLIGTERRGRNFGYGPHRVTGTEGYLHELFREMEDLLSRRPAW
jgi:hypothetical protein